MKAKKILSLIFAMFTFYTAQVSAQGAIGENVNINYYGMDVNVEGKAFVAGSFLQVGQQVTLNPNIEVANFDDNYQDVGFIFFQNESQMKAYAKGKDFKPHENKPHELRITEDDINEVGSIPVHYALFQKLENGQQNVEYHTYHLPIESLEDWQNRMVDGIKKMGIKDIQREDALVAQEFYQKNRKRGRASRKPIEDDDQTDPGPTQSSVDSQ